MKVIDKLNVHVIDYTYDNDISHVLNSLSRMHRLEIRSYPSVIHSEWSRRTGAHPNNLLHFRINQSLALRAIAKSTDSDHLIYDSYVRTTKGHKLKMEVPDRASFVLFIDNREGTDFSSVTYSALFYTQPHIAKSILSGMSNGVMNIFESVRGLSREEVCLDNQNAEFEYYRYPGFSLSEEPLLDKRILNKWTNS